MDVALGEGPASGVESTFKVDEQIGAADPGNIGREGVVAAELQLFDGDRVVLVDDRHAAHLKQGGEGILRSCATLGIINDVLG